MMTSVSSRVICIEKRLYNGMAATPFLYRHCHMNGLTKYKAPIQISGKNVFLQLIIAVKHKSLKIRVNRNI